MSSQQNYLEVFSRASDIKAFAEAEGITLGLDAEEIAQLELQGYVVDLQTGEIVGNDEQRYELTVLGEIAAIVEEEFDK